VIPKRKEEAMTSVLTVISASGYTPGAIVVTPSALGETNSKSNK